MIVTNHDLNYYFRYATDLICNKPLSASLRFVKENVKVDRQKLYHYSKQQRVRTEQSRKSRYLVYKLCIGVGTVCGVKICTSSILVSCQAAQTSRLAGLKSEENVEEDAKFDWSKFFALLWPHIWYLLAAIAVC
jgi:repressor of nif and glnA expression